MRQSRFLTGFTLLILVGCNSFSFASSVRMEENSDASGETGTRWAVVSYRWSKDEAAAAEMMKQYCAPAGYHIASDDKEATRTPGSARPNAYGSSAGGGGRITLRTYVRFECDKPE
jgi:hypothetical protein